MSNLPPGPNNSRLPSLSTEDLAGFRRVLLHAAHHFGGQLGVWVGEAVADTLFSTLQLNPAFQDCPPRNSENDQTTRRDSQNISNEYHVFEDSHTVSQVATVSQGPTSFTASHSEKSKQNYDLLPYFFWVNGNFKCELKQDDIHNGKPHVGWAFMQNATKKHKQGGIVRRHFFALESLSAHILTVTLWFAQKSLL